MLFIFDMGGVVSGNVQTIPAMAAKLGISVDDFFRFCSVPDGTPHSSRYDYGLLAAIESGAINSLAFWDLFRKNAEALMPSDYAKSTRISVVTRSENLWETCFKPEPISGTIDVIGRLKRKGHRVVCGTNTLDAHYAIHKTGGDYDVFDKVYASHFMGVIKPHRQFWEKILELEKAVPDSAVFIDDNEPNVIGAIGAGIRKSVLFTSSENLERAFAEYL